MAAPTADTHQPDSSQSPFDGASQGAQRGMRSRNADGTIWTPDHRQCQTAGNSRRPKSAPPRIPSDTVTDSASIETGWRSRDHRQYRPAGNCICKQCLYCDRHKPMPMNEKCTKCCPLLQTEAEVSYAVTMKLIDMIDDQLQIIGKTPTKTSQNINAVVTESNKVQSTIENPPRIDVISTHYQLQQEKYNIESSNSDASDVSSATSSDSGSIDEQLYNQDCISSSCSSADSLSESDE